VETKGELTKVLIDVKDILFFGNYSSEKKGRGGQATMATKVIRKSIFRKTLIYWETKSRF